MVQEEGLMEVGGEIGLWGGVGGSGGGALLSSALVPSLSSSAPLSPSHPISFSCCRRSTQFGKSLPYRTFLFAIPTANSVIHFMRSSGLYNRKTADWLYLFTPAKL